VSSPELSVVCQSCGEEVSPYVTECPYCGTRLRKRAPKLELRGDELAPRQSRRARRRQARAQRTDRLTERPYAVIAAILIPALIVLLRVASPSLDTFGLGGILGPVGGDWWRYLASPFIYPDIGYLFVASVGIALWATAGGIALFFGLMVLQGTMSFWTIESLEVANVVTYGGVQAAQYPLSLYNGWLRGLLTFVVPLAWPEPLVF